MSATFPLPLECLQLIINHLSCQGAHKSVASLLCVNKCVCAAALPILYRDPFVNLYPYSTGFDRRRKTDPAVRRLMHLVRILLLSLPIICDDQQHDLVTELLEVAYIQDLDQDRGAADVEQTEISGQGHRSTTPPRPTLLPYSSFVTRVAFEETGNTTGCMFVNGFTWKKPAVQDFLKRTGRTDRYLVEEPFRRHMRWEGADEIIVAEAAELQLRQDLTWALCWTNAERIQTLCISISDISRYLVLVPRFKVLSKVTFQLDRPLTMKLPEGQQLSQEEEKALARLKENRTKYLEEMMLFVQEHTRHHPKVIRIARCINDRVSQDPCPDEYHFRLLQSLPPLHQPHTLDSTNWVQFAANVTGIDLSCVKTIKTEVANGEVRFLSHILKQGPFLHRCRSLDRVAIASFGEDMFNWAVQERKDFDGSQEPVAFRRPLIPLRECYIRYEHPSFGRQASDIAYAFGNTLQMISIGGFHSPFFKVYQNRREFSLGCGDKDDGNLSWPVLPQLNHLSVSTGYIYIRTNSQLFAQLPRLAFLTLMDHRSHYSLANVIHWEPADMPELVHLVLIGSPAISFHPNTLKSTRNLQYLSLSLHYVEDYSFIPDPEEFDETDQGEDVIDNDSDDNSLSSTPLPRRPVWTWDWELPKLTSMYLHSEFAYRFQFRMLEGTPHLKVFSLDINSLSRLHKRTVRIVDLIKPGFQYPELDQFLERERRQQERKHADEEVKEEEEEEENDNEIWQEFAFIQLRALEIFTLDGPWTLDYRVLKVLFGKVAPHIKQLKCPDCRGFTVSEWVKSTSAHLHELQEAFMSFPLRRKMAKEAGLVRNKGADREEYCLAEPPIGRIWDFDAAYLFR